MQIATSNSSTKPNYFDYAVIGSGLAGLHLLMAMSENPFFSDKKIAVFDPNLKDNNDKTFCFWEKSSGKWDNCVSKTWEEAAFYSKQLKLNHKLNPYSYKKINSLDFYTYCLKKLESHKNIKWFVTSVIKIDQNKLFTKDQNNYEIGHIFDSRITYSTNQIAEKHSLVIQSFQGWFIKTEKPVFYENQFTMMDFRNPHKNSTSFMYALPQSPTEALVEFTLFTPWRIATSEFEQQLNSYINTHFPTTNYEIRATESGEIPMTIFPFEKANTPWVTKIGTAGGWVKASTGYCFKRSERYAQHIISTISKVGKWTPSAIPIPSTRFRFYDSLLLDILKNNNSKGIVIFEQLYKKTDIDLIFKFLDEETSIFEEIALISKLPAIPFLKSLLRVFFTKK